MSRVIYAILALTAGAALALPAHGQAVISTRSGVVHFFEGAVYVAGQPLEPRPGNFPRVPEGSELRTAQGRAEVLLTPGVFLRLGENAAIRMVATALPDTRVELLNGSAILDSSEPGAGTSVTLIYKGWKVQQPQKGVYRIDAEPARVWVRDGKAEVASAAIGVPVTVPKGMDLPLADVLVPVTSAAEPNDTLTDWAEGRAESIDQDNAIAANIQDPGAMTGLSLPGDGFTYFPMLGLSSLGSSYQSALYGSPLYQSGFYSIYLPGYTYQPLLLGLRMPSTGSGLRPSHPPQRIGIPSVPVSRTPGARPTAPPIVHPTVHVHH